MFDRVLNRLLITVIPVQGKSISWKNCNHCVAMLMFIECFLCVVSCLNLSLLVKTTNGTNCVFPFIYRKKKYSQCLPYNGKKWCATVPNYDKVPTWGYCLPTGKAGFVN